MVLCRKNTSPKKVAIQFPGQSCSCHQTSTLKFMWQQAEEPAVFHFAASSSNEILILDVKIVLHKNRSRQWKLLAVGPKTCLSALLELSPQVLLQGLKVDWLHLRQRPAHSCLLHCLQVPMQLPHGLHPMQ